MNITRLENRIVVVSETVGVSVYDFDFELFFSCDHPYLFAKEECCVLRVGAIADYAATYDEFLGNNLRLINSPEEHIRASELESWYPYISDLTPRTRVFDQPPSAAEIEAEFSWPIFLKGSRQTSKHDPGLSIIRSAEQYECVAERYRLDPILNWQKPAVREFIPLAAVVGDAPGKITPSVEYRSFWWHGRCVGWGRYWYQIPPYECSDVSNGLQLAAEVARRLAVPFLVVDFAKTQDGRWIVIECNDAQESGYVAITPQLIWRNILYGV